MLEINFQKTAIQFLENHPSVARVWSNDQDKTRMRKYTRGNKKKGLPDICGFLCHGHGPFFIELKVGRNTATPEQTEFIDVANKNGYVAFVARNMTELTLLFETLINEV